MEFSMEMLWVGVVAISVLLEIVTVGLVAIWMVGGALVACLAAALGFSLEAQIACFFGVTLALLYWTRPFAVKYLNIKRSKTNVEGIVGGEARVIERIDSREDSGRVNYKGMEWTARTREEASPIEVGDWVVIKEVVGVTMMVAPKR